MIAKVIERRVAPVVHHYLFDHHLGSFGTMRPGLVAWLGSKSVVT